MRAPPCAAGLVSSPLPTPLPALVVFDCDFTLWRRPRFQRGPPFTAIEGGLSGVEGADGKVLDLYPAARSALSRLAAAGVPTGLVSRTHREPWLHEWIELLSVPSSIEGASGSLTVAAALGGGPVVVADGVKSHHLREACRRTGVSFRDVLYFDDAARDVAAGRALGTLGVHCPGRVGLTDSLFQQGLAGWARRSAARGEQRGGQAGGIDELDELTRVDRWARNS